MVANVETVVGRGSSMAVGAEDWMVWTVCAVGLMTALMVLI